MGKGKSDNRSALILDDPRNLIDEYKGLSDEEVRAVLEPLRHKFSVLVENYANDFNLATAIRNHNAFLGSKFIRSGRRRIDTRGAVGTHKYEPLSYMAHSQEAIAEAKAQGKRVVAFAEIEGATSIYDYQFEEDTLMVFGQEQIGVSPQALKLADEVVHLPKLGGSRSLNVGSLSGIAMYEYLRQHHYQPHQKLQVPQPTPQTIRENPNYPDFSSLAPHTWTHQIDHRWWWKEDHTPFKSKPLNLLLDGVSYDLNISTVIRNKEVFGASELYLTKDSELPNTSHTNDVIKTIKDHQAAGYKVVAMDLVEEATPLWSCEFPEKSLLVFGEEQQGLSAEVLNAVDQIAYIPQFGSTRSINVGVSSGIAMYEYCRTKSS